MTIVTPRSGYDPRYYLGRWQGEQTAGGYYINPAQMGEAPGRWFGRGAEVLGFKDRQQVSEEPYMAVYQQIHPKTGEELGSKPRGYKHFYKILGEKLAAEPHATAERVRQLEREAAREVRRSPVLTDMTVSHNKSISILHAAFCERARRAKLAGNAEEEALWRGREERVQEILQEANHAALAHLQRYGAYVRTGHHGQRIAGKETGRWESAGLVVSTWLQRTNRDGEPHDHSHNVIARMAHTDSDGKWRAADTMALRTQIGMMCGIVESHVRSALTREFGVQWEPHEDPALGYEIKGIGKILRAVYSKRASSVDRKTAELAKQWEQDYGRAPNSRELQFLADKASRITRKGKEAGHADWDAQAREWDKTYGNQLAEVTEVCDFAGHHDDRAPDQEICQQVIELALERVQLRHSTWTKADLVKSLAHSMTSEFDQMPPEARQALLFRMADQAVSADAGVVCLEAPEYPVPPQKLLREIDGRSVFTRPGTERYASRGQMSLEEKLIERAKDARAPHMDRESAASALGATADELEAVLAQNAQCANAQNAQTSAGLRLDQAAMIFEGLTSNRRVSVGVGPAGSGKTFTVAAGAKAWQTAGRDVIGLTTAQAARDVLESAGIGTAYNSTRFLKGVQRGRIVVRPGTLLVIDEGSMMSMRHLAAIVRLAERTGSKIFLTGDHRQLTSVESGGGMMLLADKLGHTQLYYPVRFANDWEGEASLRLRDGDETALDAYREHGRITGYQRAELFDQARRAYVAGRLAGEDTLLMARTREDCRELSRQIRDDLVHLGLVDRGATARLSHGARASAGDLIVARKNNTRLITDRTGDKEHRLTNGDIFRVVEVTDRGVLARRVLEAGEDGSMQVAGGRAVQLGNPMLKRITDLAYAVTGHNGQGATVSRGLALITGSESREWLYVALTRGKNRNTAMVQVLPREADPNPKTRRGPELARHERVEAERAGLPVEYSEPGYQLEEEREDFDREPVAVLADCLERVESEEAATEYQRRELSEADHLAVLGAKWDDLTLRANRERYERIVREELPPEWKTEPVGDATTWLWRTLRHAETAGMDARDVIRATIGARDLGGIRDLSKALYARMSKLVDPVLPAEQGLWASEVPEMADPELHQYLREVGQATDGRIIRLGKFDAENPPGWALEGLGPVPEAEEDRRQWTERAGKIHYYRERYGVEPEAGIGPEPSAHSPEMRRAWWDAFRSLNTVEGIDYQALPERSLRRMREAYEGETSWAPPHVSKHLESVRTAMEEHRQMMIRAEAEALAATDDEVRERHLSLAAGARAAVESYQQYEETLSEAQDNREVWDQASAGPRAVSIHADAELRRRHPEERIPALRSAEPQVPDDQLTPGAEPEWIKVLDEAGERFREEHERRQALEIPDEDSDYQPVGKAYPEWLAQRDAVLQPPKPQIPPAEKVRELAKEAEKE